jgi:hypothetical protein
MTVSCYSDSVLLHLLGSARAVQAVSSSSSCKGTIGFSKEFFIIIDSGATAMMMPFRQCFISYKSMPKSYVILSNNQRSPYLCHGDNRINMGGFTVLLKDVLHILSLCCPLFSGHCHHRLIGCSFIADNKGYYLTFPSFTIDVNDSSDCIVSGAMADSSSVVHFNAHLAGIISAVSDNTRHRQQCRPSNVKVITPKDSTVKYQRHYGV